ncbi:ATP-binding protein [Candidatus Woesearchaeota archaeon]|nr:ATP-binding protein [Candidatus Woesearchaeota archaeon]
MILGNIVGKVTTTNFTFKVDDTINTRKFDFIQVMHPTNDYVLCQVVEIEKDKDLTKAFCNVIGYKDKDGVLRQLRTPFEPGSEVLAADDKFIEQVIKLDSKETASLGVLEGKENIKVNIDLKKMLTKHVAILAKTGAGKSYVSGVLVEEIMEKKVPLLIIDPHGEYSQMKDKNDEEEERLKEYGISAKGYKSQIQEYGDIDIGSTIKPLLLNEEMTPKELLNILPAKLSSAQQAALYSVMKDVKSITLGQIIEELETIDAKNTYSIMSMIDYIKSLNLFSLNFTPYNELIQPGKCSIINLKGIDPESQEIIVYKLLKDLFEMRKTNKIAPFFCVIEEAHNFIPEKGTGGEKKSSAIIRTLASEGRKFGLGLCVITQRPARIEKNVLSQCNTQIILKVTNPNDIKAISQSVEGITSQTEKEIPNLPIGTAIVTGISDMPYIVKIRPRKSKHGGQTVDILQPEELDMLESVKRFQNSEILPIIDSKFSIKEIKLMDENKKDIQTYLIPAAMITIKSDPGYNVLIDMIKGHIIADIAKKEIISINDVKNLEDVQSYEKIEFKKIQYDKKLVGKIKIEAIKKKLSLYADISEVNECFVVYHYAK